jgi:hypothetical protein
MICSTSFQIAQSGSDGFGKKQPFTCCCRSKLSIDISVAVLAVGFSCHTLRDVSSLVSCLQLFIHRFSAI